MLAMHRVRCVTWKPTPITALATTPIHTTADADDIEGRYNDDHRNQIHTRLENGQTNGLGVRINGTSDRKEGNGNQSSALINNVNSKQTKEAQLLAVSRESGKIEIWRDSAEGVYKKDHRKGNWELCLSIPGCHGIKYKCLCWVAFNVKHNGKLEKEYRLIGCTLDGKLLLWDLRTCQPQNLSADFTGCGIWCMKVAYNEETLASLGYRILLACACDDGILRVFGVKMSNDQLESKLVCSYPKVASRLLSLVWHGNTNIVVGGTEGYVGCWNINRKVALFSNHHAHNRKKEIQVWCMDILQDGDIVTGDSSGSVNILDAQFGTLIKSFQMHKADVLSIVSYKDKIFSTGVDAQIMLLQKEGKEYSRWVFKGKKRPHSHDVQCLALSRNTLFSAGNDTRLLYCNADFFLQRHPYCLQAYGEVPKIEVTDRVGEDAVWMLCQQANAIEVWQVSLSKEAVDAMAKEKGIEGQALENSNSPKLLAVFHCQNNIFASSISRKGTHVVYTEMSKLCVYKLSTIMGNKIEVAKVGTQQIPCAKSVNFTNESKELIVLTLRNSILLFNLENLTQLQNIDLKHSTSSINSSFPHFVDEVMKISPNNKLIAVTNQKQAVFLYDLKTWSFHGVILDIGSISTMSFDDSSKYLVIGTTKKRILFYDVSTSKCTAALEEHSKHVDERLKYLSGCVTNISCLPSKRDGVVLINTIKGICFAHVSKPINTPKPINNLSRKRKHNRELDQGAQEGQNPRILPLEDPCLFASFLDRTSAIIVECPWLKAIKNIPKPMTRQVYGL